MYIVCAMMLTPKYIHVSIGGIPTVKVKGETNNAIIVAKIVIFAKPLPLFLIKAFHDA